MPEWPKVREEPHQPVRYRRAKLALPEKAAPARRNMDQMGMPQARRKQNRIRSGALGSRLGGPTFGLTVQLHRGGLGRAADNAKRIETVRPAALRDVTRENVSHQRKRE